MNWKFINIAFGFIPLQKLAAVGPIIHGALSAAGSIGSSLLSSSAAGNINSKNRRWQEEMYNKYSSPAAMLRQYRQAGINPFIGADLGSEMSATPSQAMPDIKDFGSVAAQGLSAGVEASQVSSLVGNQKAEEFMKLTEGLSQAVRDFGVDGAKDYLSIVNPRLKALGFDEFTINKIADLTVATQAAQFDILQIDAKWQKDFGYNYKSDLMMRNQQEIDEVVARIGLMSRESQLTEAKISEIKQSIKESFSRIAVNFAEALNLKKQGDYYVANTETANQIRNLVVDQMVLQNGLSGLSLLSNRTEYDIQQAGAEIKRKQASDPVLQGVKFGLETLGNVIHVGGNFSWSNMQGSVNSWSNVRSNGNVNTYNHPLGSPVIPIKGF